MLGDAGVIQCTIKDPVPRQTTDRCELFSASAGQYVLLTPQNANGRGTVRDLLSSSAESLHHVKTHDSCSALGPDARGREV